MTAFPDSHRDLLRAPVAVLATRGADGHPQVSALWFVLDGDTPALSFNTSRQKTKNLQRDPACTLCLLDPATPYRTLEIRARAELRPDTEGRVAGQVQRKYGADVRQNDRAGETRLAVILPPIKINTWG